MSTYDENIKILSKLDCNIKFAVVGANEAILCDRIKILEKMLKYNATMNCHRIYKKGI